MIRGTQRQINAVEELMQALNDTPDSVTAHSARQAMDALQTDVEAQWKESPTRQLINDRQVLQLKLEVQRLQDEILQLSTPKARDPIVKP